MLLIFTRQLLTYITMFIYIFVCFPLTINRKLVVHTYIGFFFFAFRIFCDFVFPVCFFTIFITTPLIFLCTHLLTYPRVKSSCVA